MHKQNWRIAPETFPIPKGNSLYAQAKRAEYLSKDVPLAKSLYSRAISEGDRTESALKDLASLLHQEGATAAACDLLVTHSESFSDKQKFKNLLATLQEKLVPTANSLNKQVRISPLSEFDSIASVRRLFREPSRVLHIELVCSRTAKFALISFSSHSAARKTLLSFFRWNSMTVEWVNISGEVVGAACNFKNKPQVPKKKKELKPSGQTTAERLLGKDLFLELLSESEFNAHAEPFFPECL